MADAPAPTSSLIPAGQEDRYREFDAPAFLKVEIDPKTMYCGMLPITTASEDRQGEIIDPKGALLDFHKSSPVICWQHSHKLAPMLPPIARAEKPDGTYDVKLVDGVLYSGCTFSQATKLASQVFALINEGMVRARSIGAIGHKLEPYTPEAPGQVMYDGKIVQARSRSVIYRVWEMLEWSWVIIPANRDITIAVKSVLDRKRVDGQSLDPFLELTLKALNLREPVQVPGFSFVTKSFDGVNYKVPEQLCKGGSPMKGAAYLLFDSTKVTPGAAKAFLAANPDLIETPLVFDQTTKCLKSTQVEYQGAVEIRPVGDVEGVSVALIKCDQPMQKATKSTKSDEGLVPASEVPVIPGADSQMPETKSEGEGEVPEVAAVDDAPAFQGLPGSRLLQALAASLDEIVEMVNMALEEQEDPVVKSKTTEIGEMLNEITTSVKELHDSVYTKPDAVKLLKNEVPAEGAEPATDAEIPEPDAEKRKSMLAKFYRQPGVAVLPRSVVSALSSVLKSLPATDATKTGREVLGGMLKGVIPTQQDSEGGMSDLKKMLIERAKKADMKARLQGIVG